MLNQKEMKEALQNQVTITDFSFEIVEAAIKFCYGFSDHIKDSMIGLLAVFADYYDLKCLKVSF